MRCICANYRSMKYRSNNPTNRPDSSGFIKFDMNDKRTRPYGFVRARPKKKKLIIKSNIRARMAKNSIRSEGNRFCDKAEKLISAKGNFAEARVAAARRANALVPSRARAAAIYAIIYRHRKRVITFHCPAMHLPDCNHSCNSYGRADARRYIRRLNRFRISRIARAV